MPPVFRSFKLALIQLGGIGTDKSTNLQHAREMIIQAAAAAGHAKKPDLIVLPECFNSPYGHVHFPVYAEEISFTPGQPYDVSQSPSASVRMLSSTARETKTWLIGGNTYVDLSFQFKTDLQKRFYTRKRPLNK
ncbi:hypothetical protein H0H93_012888 [Arthromyces matolae]|nr:hypothetical protein H0H93_012888 [Arthromyces matolae]